MTSEQAFTAFVRAESRGLLRSAWLLTGNWHSAEDLAQAVLLQVWRRWALVAASDSPPAYTRRILFTTFLRDQRPRWARELAVPELPDQFDQANLYEVSDRRLALQRALSGLPPRQRAVLVLRYFTDLTEVQTAATLGCSVGAVKSHTAKAFRKMRRDPRLAGLLSEEVRQ